MQESECQNISIRIGGGKNEVRQSNFELLRIVAMFLVLIVHTDFFSLGKPTFEDCVAHPISSMMRYVVQSFSLVCVNVYIIISGYFRIKLRIRSVLNFVFLVVFWRVLINIVFFTLQRLDITSDHIGSLSFLRLCIPGFDDWFVMAYILLLFLAPLINSYIDKCSTRGLWVFVICYEGAQVLLAWLLGVWLCFGSGYSVLSFVGLYMLGAAIRRTNHEFIRRPFLLYLSISAAVGII
ncbi:MAG: hypothetical protein K2H87_00700, partial [Duncaniella sp.]|nr:hypothetical protein [Duncaniella sp.]